MGFLNRWGVPHPWRYISRGHCWSPRCGERSILLSSWVHKPWSTFTLVSSVSVYSPGQIIIPCSFSGMAPKCLAQGRAMVIDMHTSPPDMELSKCAWSPLRWKQEAPSRQGYLCGAPCRGEHPTGRAEHMVYTFLQGHKPREWTGNEGKEMAVMEHHNPHSDCLSQSVLPTDLWGGNMTSIPQIRKPQFREAKLLIYILQWILVMLGVKLRSEE